MKLKFQFLFFLLFSLNAFSQELLPFVENFTKSDYNGDNQVWSVTQGGDNAMYFANNHNFLRYNGVKWERYSLPNKTVIRSVFAYKEKIYCGSYNEFGYWKREKGFMRYYSLSKDKDFFKDSSKNEEIWKIFELNGTIYFQSFNEIFSLTGNTIQRVKVPFLISYCFIVDAKIYVASVNKGVFEFNGKDFTFIKKWDTILNNVIHAIDKNEEEIFIFTLKNGVFVEKNGRLQAWNHPINEALKSEVIITAKFYQANKLVIGTASKGVYIVQMDSGEFININRNNRLSNNSILSISVDKENDIWLGLDNGISHIEINSPFRIFSDNTGELGTVYSIAASPNGYLLGSNHGVFTYENKVLKIIPNSQGQVWNVTRVDNSFVIGHNDGTFLYDFNAYRKVNPLNGGWQLKKDLYYDRYIQSNYLGLAFFEDKKDLSKYKRLNTAYRPIKDFVQTGQYEIVASDSYRGLFKIKYDERLDLVSYINLTEKNNIKSDFGVKIFKYKNDVLYYINMEWYYLDGVTDVLKKHELFNKNFKKINEVIPIDDSSFAIIKGGLFYIINQSENHFSWKLIPKKYYEGKIINHETRIFKYNDQYLVNLDDGFLQFESNKNDFINQKVEIEAYLKGQILDDDARIPNDQSLSLHFVSDYFGNKKSTLFYKLNDQDMLPLTDGKLILNNLSSGKNNIEVYFTNGFKFIKADEFSFTVLKPWYLSFWMILFYFAIVAGILFLYYRWNKVRYQEKIKLKEEELKHHRQIMELEMEAENKLKLQDYEKHILEMQVQSKASEVAGKSLSIAKQSEMIESIQRILEEENSVNTIKTKIKKAIKSNAINQREWENFEKNLIQSHEEFVQKLTNTFPELTSKDIKLSIYLRMNLSSKEIAPLMNISYRGVELHRYRLRKKIQLGPDESLSRFMINL